MVVLALDTATKRGSIAISIDDEIHAREGDDTRTHGERLPGEILDWLQQHGRTLDDVDLFAVVAGPGSFTGLRVGMAAIQGIALVRQRRVIAIPTLESMASAWLDAQRDRGPLLVPCLDGQRGDVFVAAYDSIGATTVEDCRVEVAPTVTRPEQAAADVAAVADARQVIVIGNGGQRYASAFRRELPNATMVDVAVPLAAAAVRLATRRASAAVSPHALRPVYLRRPDAVLARERARRYAPVTDEASASGARFWITRGIGPDDLIAVESLQRRAFTNPWGAEAIRWELEHTDVARLYVMRDDEGLLVAYCACWMVFDELHINSLAVEETLRRRGIARTLLKHVLADASAAGASSATLEVRQSNVAARQLYEGLGFKIEGIRRDYYQDPREDALILWHRDLTVFRRP